MACDIITSPFHETSAFEEDWQKAVNDHNNTGDLGLIAEFNASCDNNTVAFDDNTSTSIDPQLLSSAAPSPEPSTNIFDQAFNTQDDFNYPDFNQPTPANTPYFHAAEASHAPLFASSPLRNQLHRRSVSEPPEAFPHQHIAPHFIPAGPPMTLTRQGHYLGQPKPQRPGPRLMKSLPKSGKACRGYPYAGRGRAPPPPSPLPQHHYNTRHSRPQPVHAHTIGPTSMPAGEYMPSPPLPPPPQQVYSSRVCTPAPSPPLEMMAASPGAIDPVLKATTPERKIVSIPVDELSSMITDAVRKAIEGIAAGKKGDDSAAVSEAAGAGAEMEVVDEDENVVASVEGA